MKRETVISQLDEVINFASLLQAQRAEMNVVTPDWFLTDIQNHMKKEIWRINTNKVPPKIFREWHYWRLEDEVGKIDNELLKKIGGAQRAYRTLPMNFRLIDLFFIPYTALLMMVTYLLGKIVPIFERGKS